MGGRWGGGYGGGCDLEGEWEGGVDDEAGCRGGMMGAL